MNHSQPLLPEQMQNFDTIKRAARNDDLALVQCTDAQTGQFVAAVCVVNRNPDGSMEFIPVARMLNDPFKELVPPIVRPS